MVSGTFRVFPGENTRQVDGHTGAPAQGSRWYYEPLTYQGDILWSIPYGTQTQAAQAALHEEGFGHCEQAAIQHAADQARHYAKVRNI